MKPTHIISFAVSALCMAYSGVAVAQFHNRDVITIQPGADLYLGEAATNHPGAAINNSGTLHLQSDFTNNGTAAINNLVKIDGSGTQSISGVSTFELLEVDKSAGTATITGGTSSVTDILRMRKGTMNANGNLVIVSNAAGTGLIDDFTVTAPPGVLSGNVRVQRYIDGSPSNGFHHIGSAVSNPAISELSELNLYGSNNVAVTPLPTCDPLQLDPSSNYGNLFEWHENGPFSISGCQQDGWYVRSAGSLSNGRGYAALVFNAPATLEMQGLANTSAFTPVSFPNLSYTNSTGNGWQLVSNPFPSPVVWGSIPAGFDSQANFWQDGGYYSGTYQSITPATHPGYLIPSMQGFFVRTPSGTQNFVLQQTDRSLGDPPFFFEVVNNKLELIIEGNGFADLTTLYFNDEGPTNSIDSEFDAWKMLSNGNQPTLYTVAENEKISINALQFTGHPNTIPMGLLPGTDGSYTITAHGLNTFDMASQIFLEDLREGVIQNLFTDPVYPFTASATDNPARFLLHFNLAGQTTGINNPGNDVIIYSYGSTVNMLVNFPRAQKAELRIYNMLGQEVYSESGSYLGHHEIKMPGIATGNYIVRALFEKQSYTKRIILAEK